MKKALLLLPAFLLSFFYHLNAQVSGGPDAYGYTWLHSNATNGPQYNWIDIVPFGTEVAGLLDDNSVGWIPIGFDFHYYWSDYDKVRIGSNGWISFNNVSNIAHGFPNIPTAGGAGDNFLAPFLTDLNFERENNNGRAYYWSNLVDTFIVTYHQVPFWTNANPNFTGSNTFQVILSAADSSITFQYQNQSGTGPNTTLIDVVYGIENVTGTIGLECNADVYPVAPAAIKFYYPDNVTLEVKDVETSWNQNPANEGLFFFKGSTAQLTTNVANVGNTRVDPPSTATANFLNLNQVTSYVSQLNLDTLDVGEDTSLTFPNMLNMPTAGDFTYRVSVDNNTDINLSNNTNDLEIVVVDSLNGEVVLSYFTPDSGATGIISWQGGNGAGLGVHFDAPFYPATINAVEVLVTANDVIQPNQPIGSGFTLRVTEILPQGDPGTIIAQESRSGPSLTPGQWNRVDLSTPVTVYEDFYVQWTMDGDSIALGTDDRPPFSRRSYEVLSGGWAKYRSGETEDLAIRVILDSDSAMVDTSSLAIGEWKDEESTHALKPNYPNPASGSTTIEFYLAHHTDAALEVYEISGKLVNSFQYRNAQPGTYRLPLNTEKMSKGIYIYALKTNEKVMARKLVVE